MGRKSTSRASRASEVASALHTAAEELRGLLDDTTDKEALIEAANEIITGLDLGEIESHMDEMTSWRDNMEGTNLENTQKYSDVSETAEELEGIDTNIPEITDVDEIDSTADTLDEIADTLEGLNFPGMYG
jgi:hypothetical protein